MRSDEDSRYRVGERGGGLVALRRFGIGMGADGLNCVSRSVEVWRVIATVLIVPILSGKQTLLKRAHI